MEQGTESNINAALAGLAYTARKIREALDGPAYSPNDDTPGRLPPALRRVGEIADGAAIADMQAAQADLIYCFDFQGYLRGPDYDALQGMLLKAHERCAEWISKKEADEILGRYWVLLEIYISRGWVHPRVHSELNPPFIWDGARSGGNLPPFYKVEYASYEIVEVRRRADDSAAVVAQYKAEQATKEAQG